MSGKVVKKESTLQPNVRTGRTPIRFPRPMATMNVEFNLDPDKIRELMIKHGLTDNQEVSQLNG